MPLLRPRAWGWRGRVGGIVRGVGYKLDRLSLRVGETLQMSPPLLTCQGGPHSGTGRRGVAESLRFSPGEKQQEATHLHFQRPAPTASPPQGRDGELRACLGPSASGDPGKGLSSFPRPQHLDFSHPRPPPQPLERRVGWCDPDGQTGSRWPL